MNTERINLYPESYHLYGKIADYYGVSIDELFLTCGADQALDYTFRLFVDRGSKVVFPNPTFGMVPVYAQFNQADICTVDYSDSLLMNVKTFVNEITDSTSLCYLANPDNPTGASYSLGDIEAIAQKCSDTGHTIFLLDETYFHYYCLDTHRLLEKYPALVIARSFSKAWGLAGARVGFLMSNRDNIGKLRNLRPMHELNSMTIELVMKIMDNDRVLQRNIEQVRKWKSIFSDESLPGLKYINTKGNYILLRSESVKRHFNALYRRKILPRLFEESCLKDCIRLSVARDDIMENVLRILKNA